MPDTTPTIRDLMGSSLTTGFNAKSWKLAAEQIFEPQYTRGQTVVVQHQGADATFRVPDGITVNADIGAFGSDVTIFRHGISDLESDFSTSVEASVSAEGVSADATYSLARTSNVKTDQTSNSVLVTWYKTIFSFARGDAPAGGYALVENFSNEVAALPAAYATNTKAKFFAFFDKWGTHYLYSGWYGGGWTMTTTMQDSALNTLDTEKIKASVSASFTNGMNSGSAKSSVETDTRKALSLNEKDLRTTWRWYGGNAGDDLATWLASVDKSPQLLNDPNAVLTEEVRPRFRTIWTLVAAENVKDALRAAYADYAPATADGETELMPAVTVPLFANTQTVTDGFLQAIISPQVTTGTVDLGQVYACTDSALNPATIVAAASMHEYYASQITQATLFTPVRAGEYYRLQKGQGSAGDTFDGEGPGRQDGEPKLETSFQPFPLGLGAWTPRDTDKLYQAASDGFVVASITSTIDGNRGYILGWQGAGALENEPFSGASIHRFSGSEAFLYAQSFCMPVHKGNVYKVEFVKTDSRPAARVFWIPLGASYAMGPLEPVVPPNSNLAKSNGILFGVLDANAAESLGAMTFEVSADNTFATPTTVGRIAAQQSVGSDKRIPYNSAAAFVKKGQHYRALTKQRTGTVKSTVRFVDIKPVHAS